MHAKPAIDRICTDLGIWRGDAFTQDWAWEMPEEFRTDTWLERYLAAFVRQDYGPHERHELFDLIFDIANDSMWARDSDQAAIWLRIWPTLSSRMHEHRDQLEYWACLDGALEDVFALSPFARAVLAESPPGGSQGGTVIQMS